MAKPLLSNELFTLGEMCDSRVQTVRDLFVLIDSRGQAILTLLVTLPFLLFIPLPGIAIPFGFFIFFNGYRISRRKRLWFPSFLLGWKVSGTQVARGLKQVARWIAGLEKVSHPRLTQMNQWSAIRWTNAVVMAGSGLLLVFTIIPGSSWLPAITVTLLAIGIAEEDGLFVIFSYLMFVMSVFFYIYVPIVSAEKILSFFVVSWGP